jgi:NADH-quinone oxidoreductase subunit H
MDYIIYKTIVCFSVLVLTLLVALYSTLAERKISAFLQDRVGPNRAGPGGILQPIADGIKFIFKEEFTPAGADKFLFYLAPAIAIGIILMFSAVIPWGDTLIINGKEYPLQVTDIDVGLLYILGVLSLTVYGIMIGGWASNNKYSLLGALRASSQVISYELAMGIALVALLLTTGTLSLGEIAEQQNGFRHWNIWVQPLGFLIFLICVFAESKRVPFDLPEAEAELVAGYHTEYSSMKLGLFLFGEYIGMFFSSVLMSVLYFGGYNFPFMNDLGLSHNWLTILGSLALLIKASFFIFLFMWVRWTIPRFRYDQLMRLGWVILIPLSLFNLFVTGVVIMILEKI